MRDPLFAYDGTSDLHPSEIAIRAADEVYERIKVKKEEYKTSLEEPAEDSPRAYWAKIAKIALPRFPNVTPKLRDQMVRQALRDLRSNNYPIENYSSLTPDQRWEYLIHTVRPEVYKNTELYCPEVLTKIRKSELSLSKPNIRTRKSLRRGNLQSLLNL
jgi:hypothetical protein|tara:strand:+ start:561 stop:1037 length:477 start_codon:yes stop_codon:yes gene_type:complete